MKVDEYKQQLTAENQRLYKILANIQFDTERKIPVKTDAN